MITERRIENLRRLLLVLALAGGCAPHPQVRMVPIERPVAQQPQPAPEARKRPPLPEELFAKPPLKAAPFAGRQPPAGAAKPEPRFYRCGPGDKLRLEVDGLRGQEKELSGDRLVQIDGTLTVPQLGPIRAEGHTLEELRRELTKGFAKTILEPRVRLTLIEPRPRIAYVTGGVPKPGKFPLGPNTRIAELLTEAGWSPALEDLDRLVIVRGQATLQIPLSRSAIQRQNFGWNRRVHEGDILFVVQRRPVHVAGTVTKPGPVPLKDRPALSVAEVLTHAGLAAGADRRHAVILRAEGAREAIDLTGPTRSRTLLHEGDTLFVPRAGAVQLVGQFSKPGEFLLEHAQRLPLAALVTQAGGVLRTADLQRALLLRRTGEASRIDLTRLADDRTLLGPGDLVYLPARPQVSVQVIGQGGRPAAVTQTAPFSLTQALARIQPDPVAADLTQIRVVRDWPHDPRIFRIDARALLAGRTVQSLALADGDVIYIPPTTVTNVLGHMNQLLAALETPLKRATEATDLAKDIQTYGLTVEAKKQAREIRRQGGSTSVTTTTQQQTVGSPTNVTK